MTVMGWSLLEENCMTLIVSSVFNQEKFTRLHTFHLVGGTLRLIKDGLP